MGEYYLYNLNLEKIYKISSLAKEFGLKSINIGSDDPFISKFKKNFWTKDNKLQIKIHQLNYPIHISTLETGNIELKYEPNFGLIKKIVEELECKSVCNSNRQNYDMLIFNPLIKSS